MKQQFDQSILGIAQAYGPYGFWLENLFPGANPDATWRGLMVISALRDKAFINQALSLLNSPDSRVRAWSCYYLGKIMHFPASDHLFALTNDQSPRVRYYARNAYNALQPGSETALGNRRFLHNEFQVLVSEDHIKARNQIALGLKQYGFTVSTAETEKDTIALAQTIKPQVIITDNQKGRDNLSGLNMIWDLCRIPELRETILIMLTADYIEPIFLWQGGDFFLNKFRYNGAKLGEVLEMYMR